MNEIDSGDALRDRMLDLKPGVHLQKVEVLLRVQQELDRAGGVVSDGFRKGNSLRTHCSSILFGRNQRLKNTIYLQENLHQKL
jgi:hypothetical protein